ncbi:MAG: hypothetical protein HY370_05520 [Proteobacteria bacterium]|nr:hypothetical protein [Pseudomonadota bacterium]
MNYKMIAAAATLALLPHFAVAAQPAPAKDEIPQEVFSSVSPKNLMEPSWLLEDSMHRLIKEASVLKQIAKIPVSVEKQLKPSDLLPK